MPVEIWKKGEHRSCINRRMRRIVVSVLSGFPFRFISTNSFHPCFSSRILIILRIPRCLSSRHLVFFRLATYEYASPNRRRISLLSFRISGISYVETVWYFITRTLYKLVGRKSIWEFYQREGEVGFFSLWLLAATPPTTTSATRRAKSRRANVKDKNAGMRNELLRGEFK